MPQIVNFIDSAYFRSRTDIGVNYNETNVSNAVADAQELELVERTGRGLYDALQAHVVAFRSADATPIPTAYKTLLDDFIAPFVVQTAYYNMLDSIYLRPTSTGIGTRNFSGGTAISAAQYDKKRDNIRPKVDHFARRLDQYLTDQGTSVFPELDDSEDLQTDRRKILTSTSSPLLTSRVYRRGPNIY